MCKHGCTVDVYVMHKDKVVPVDSCIAEEIAYLNEQGVITVGSCCGHGEAGKWKAIENGYGLTFQIVSPPHALVMEESVAKLRLMGYKPYPYFYLDNAPSGVWQVQLKTGDISF